MKGKSCMPDLSAAKSFLHAGKNDFLALKNMLEKYLEDGDVNIE